MCFYYLICYLTLFFKESFFQRNKGIIKSELLEDFYKQQKNGLTLSYIEEFLPEIGGPLYLRPSSVIIKDCFFSENNGNMGGVVFLGKKINLNNNQIFQMERCVFFNNTGGQSGCIEFALDLQYFEGSIYQSYFNFNRAGCNIFFLIDILINNF